jgi:3-deoxy-D-manno-octulosonate 8-phosphate phosphatase (KDO 8-P phosphatase)
MSLSAADRARRIRVILFDVDGVLTDGAIWFLPSAMPGDEAKLVEVKGFNAHDGSGISLARIGGIKCGIVTKRSSNVVALRARDLRLEYVYLGQSSKMHAVREILQKESITVEEIAYVGDDVIDLPVMRRCGLAIAVPNARPQVIAAAHHVTRNPGGQGAGRDAIEFILEAQGILEQCIEKYIDEGNPG